MRPPDHWHLRPRRSRKPWWTLGAGAGLILLILLFVTVCASSSASGPTSAVAPATQCPPEVCPPFGPDEPSPSVLISGRAAAIIEAPCGALLYAQRAHEQFRPASVTKIVTALVAHERADLDRIVDVNVNSQLLVVSTDSTVMGLEPGMRLSLRDLMYGLLLVSGNDAAIAIATAVGGTLPAFIEMMNDKVAELGLQNTRFANPHGLDESNHYTTAYDIAQLGRALLDEPELAQIVRAPHYTANWDGPEIWNGNALLTLYPNVVGVKIGFTEQAKQTIVAAADRGDRRLIVSVLGSNDRYSDAIALLDWAWLNTDSACDEAGVRATS